MKTGKSCWESLKRHFKSWTCYKWTLYLGGRQIKVKGHTDVSGCDRKMVGLLLGDTGGGGGVGGNNHRFPNIKNL